MTPDQWNQIKHFSPNEKWGDPEKMDFFLLGLLNRLREQIGKPFIIHCGYELTGHATKSFHKTGQAVDFHIKGIDLYTAWGYINEMWWMGGAGIYPEWNNPGCHLDIGSHRRWSRNADGAYFSIKNNAFERGL